MSKILVIRGGAIGDFILTLPVLTALRQRFPNVQLDVLGYPHIAQLAVAGGLADHVRSVDARPLAGFFARGAIPDPALQDYFAGFAIIVSYLYDPDGIFESNVRRSCKGQFIAGPHRPDESKNDHATAVFLEPLKRLAIFDADPTPRIALPSDGPVASSHQSKQIAIHPGSGSEKKNWPLEKWIELARQLLKCADISLLVVGGEAEAARIEVFKKALPERVDVAFNLPLPRLAARLASCSQFIGHDSGITHLAAAVGIPVIALWGETSEAVWGPQGDRVFVVQSRGGLKNLEVDAVASVVKFARPIVPGAQHIKL